MFFKRKSSAFKEFFAFAGAEDQKNINSVEQFLDKYEGCTLLDGMYRLFKKQDVEKWNRIVGRAFPPAMGKVQVFGYDWQGRVFAIFKETDTVLILEPGTGEAFDTEKDFCEFHNVALPADHAFCLQSTTYKEWRQTDNSDIAHNQCVSYIIPLFLGGKDEIENLELSDMEVYWTIMTPLINE